MSWHSSNRRLSSCVEDRSFGSFPHSSDRNGGNCGDDGRESKGDKAVGDAVATLGVAVRGGMVIPSGEVGVARSGDSVSAAEDTAGVDGKESEGGRIGGAAGAG